MMTPEQAFAVRGQRLAAGTPQCDRLPVVCLYPDPLSMPVQVVRGRRPRPGRVVRA